MQVATPSTFSPPFSLMYSQGVQDADKPLLLGQVSSTESTEADADKQRYGLNRKNLDTGVSSVK